MPRNALLRHGLALTLTLVLVGSFVTSARAIPVTNGLIGYWAGEGNADDSSGNGNHGTLSNGATFDQGILGQGFGLNGPTDFIEVPALQERTISMWVNPAVQQQMGFFAGGSVGVGSQALEIGIYEPGGLIHGLGATFDTTFGLYIAFWSNDIAVPFDDLKSGWHHVAVSWDGGTGVGVAIDGQFLDGYVLDPSLPWALQSQSPTFDLYAAPAPDPLATTLFGTTRHVLHGAGQQNFQGRIDEVAIYDRPLSASEVQSLAAVPEPSSLSLLGPGLVALAWPRSRRPGRTVR